MERHRMKKQTTGAAPRVAKKHHRKMAPPIGRKRGNDTRQRKSELRPMPVTLDVDTIEIVDTLARKIVRKTGVRFWQARAAIIKTAYQMTFSGDL